MKKRVWSILLTLCMVFALLPAAASAANVLYSGTCGEHATYVVTDDGVMTISGTGTVTFYQADDQALEALAAAETIVIEEGVTEIGEHGFAVQAFKAECVVLPDSLTVIKNTAFSWCETLKEVVFGSGLIRICYDAFNHCTGLTELDFPDSLQDIQNAAFCECSGLQELYIPGSVRTVGIRAFADCMGLQFAYLDDGVQSVNDYAFARCGFLESVVLPDSITNLGVHVFDGCRRLTEARIPANLQKIPAGLFHECTALDTVIFSNRVQTIEIDAFNACIGLTSIFYAGTEAQLKRITISNIGNQDLAHANVYLIPTMPDPVFGLFDMPAPDNWAYDGIAFCLATGLMNGMGNGYFQPNGTTTRAQLVTILWRMMDEPEASKSAPFTDLTQDWYREAVAWAAENGITTGTSATTFDPNAPVTREQMVTIFYRMCRDYLELDVSPSVPLTAFPDNAKVSPWAKDALQWGVAVKLINGVGDGSGNVTLQPQGSATRAQIATVMLNFVTAFQDEL